MPQLTGNVGQRSLHSARISEETRTADTATLCQTQKTSRYGVAESNPRPFDRGGNAETTRPSGQSCSEKTPLAIRGGLGRGICNMESAFGI